MPGQLLPLLRDLQSEMVADGETTAGGSSLWLQAQRGSLGNQGKEGRAITQACVQEQGGTTVTPSGTTVP